MQMNSAAPIRPSGSADSSARSKTRELLLDAARRLILRQGWAQTSMTELAREAGLSTGAIYSNFRGGDWLLLETLTESRPALGLLVEPETSARDAIQGFARRYVRTARTPAARRFVAAEACLLAACAQDPELAAALAARVEQWIETLGEQLLALVGGDASRLAGKPKQAALALHIAVTGLAQVCLTSPDLVTESLVQRIVYAAVLAD
jgi:AcrR family transcriptional regulator